jgi:outer membrane autotransporter protein
MKRRFAKSIIIGAGFLLLAGPGLVRPSFSEVVLQDTYTTALVLEDQANSADNQTNATIKSGASVTAETGKYAILGKTDGWNITVENGATVAATGSNGLAIWLNAAEDLTQANLNGNLTNKGTLLGDGPAVILGTGTVVNEKGATITSSTSDGVWLSGGSSTVINEGSINGGASAVAMESGGNTLINKEGGTLTGTGAGGRGVYIVDGGTVINERNASITGVQGVYFGGSGNDTLDNAGTIIGTGGTAVSMGSGDDTTYLRDGSAITGTVKGGNGTDTIYLEGSGTITEGTITGWETIEKSGDGTWSLGGDLSSGKSISVLGGALKVSGVYTHEAGATYTVGAGSDGKAGKITADTAVLNGGNVSVVTKGLKGGTHTIVETTNGLTGTFDSVTSDSKYREMSLAYDAKNSYLNMRSNFKKAGARGTRGNVASAIDDAYSNSSSDDMVTVVDELFTLDDGALNSALDQISGTTHSVSSTVTPAKQGAFYQNLFGRTGGTTGLGFLGLNDRQSDPLTMLASGGPVASDAGFTLTRDGQKLPYGMWIKGYSVTGNRHGDDVGSRYDYTIGGAIAGFDYLINPNIRAGVAVGYSKTSVDMKQLRDNSDAESWQGAIYGSYVPTSKLWYVDAAFAYSKNSYETKRYLNFGNIYRVARGSYDGSDISGYLEGGYKVPIFGGITATPLASFLAMCNHTDSFTETGAGALNLESDSNHTDSYQSGLGVKLSREFKAAKDFTLTPEFGAKWLHEFGDTEANINARFAGEPAGSFVINSSTAKRDTGVFSLNLTGKKSDMLNFFVGYDLGITSDQISHGFTGGLRFNW